MNEQMYLERIVSWFEVELKVNLLGIYLHGSLAMGCFNPKSSDIDFIVVVREQLSTTNKRRIAEMALMMTDEMPGGRGLEFSVILETCLKPFLYPTPCELHYSDFHKEKYRSDGSYVCGGFDDYDLASQMSVAYHRGVPLYGRPLHELYEPVDRSYYLASILHDVEGASQDILENAMYMTLNLCRVLLFLREGKISSKKEGGAWGVGALPHQYRGLILSCMEEYAGTGGREPHDRQLLSDFADYMLREIKR